MDTIRLRRGWLARLRTIGLFDFVIWGLLAWSVAESRHGVHDVGDVGLVLLGVACLAWRIAIATEWVRCDSDGVSWRSMLAVHSVPWEQVAGVGVGARPMRLPISRRRDLLVQCLQIDVGEGGRSRWVTPSIWVPIMRQAEFIAAARLASPVDWSQHESPTSPRSHPGRSGKRVGRPSSRADRQQGR